MKIAHIIPGSGDTFYCENCLRDTALVKAQRALGHSVVMAPLYLPLFGDAPDIAGNSPVFYGALNVYLSESVPLFGALPRWLRRLLDAPGLLRAVATMAGSTRARSLEKMTLSMLRGEEGRQARELERLVLWLRDQVKPDVVHLSNALLLGLARRIHRTLGVPIVCSLQDEDAWIDAMRPETAQQAWDIMAARASDIAVFTPVSHYYGDVMRQRLRLAPSRLQVVPIGIELEGRASAPLDFATPVVGYLSRLCAPLGLATLVDAFIALKRDPAFRTLKLRAAGGQVGDDARFVAQLKARLARAGMADDAEFLPSLDLPHRAAFLQSLTVLSVPAQQPEAFGTYVLEAMAAGVPVVQPHHGAFPEIIEATHGGITYDPASTPDHAAALAQALRRVVSDQGLARNFAAHGRAAVLQQFGIEHMARRLTAIYERCISSPSS